MGIERSGPQAEERCCARAEAFIPKIVKLMRRMTPQQRVDFRWTIDEAMREGRLDPEIAF
jgi:hypothetical protein